MQHQYPDLQAPTLEQLQIAHDAVVAAAPADRPENLKNKDHFYLDQVQVAVNTTTI